MKNIADYLKKKAVKNYVRKDAERRILITEITRRLNIERDRDNEEKITRFMWTNQASRAKAIATLSKLKDPKEKTYSPFQERAIYFKVSHLDTSDLQDFFDTCNAREKDGKSFSKCFFGNLKI